MRTTWLAKCHVAPPVAQAGPTRARRRFRRESSANSDSNTTQRRPRRPRRRRCVPKRPAMPLPWPAVAPPPYCVRRAQARPWWRPGGAIWPVSELQIVNRRARDPVSITTTSQPRPGSSASCGILGRRVRTAGLRRGSGRRCRDPGVRRHCPPRHGGRQRDRPRVAPDAPPWPRRAGHLG
ncbi:asparagine synthase 1 domain protein [Mycobacterium kansasii 662]|uniref:Asparagine synthase 1 domain protein n=2 Tax=Mycobacterium kansasii TaxID=1768 RepID=A0A1V3WN57_MYCKA|nr:asparagine synthase 1 domain protein [Mycobacterium kansasii 662]KEP41188.1 hypothetical protein MKSMC1_36090 [Mycobacterium kansasii]OOK68375.1 asparagine synthase 1 domain protein [Mycobacterium kansasii]